MNVLPLKVVHTVADNPEPLLSGRRVLVVEDEFLIALDAQRILEDAGAGEVLLAKSVEEVEAILASGTPIDIGILDVKLGTREIWPIVDDMRARGIPLVVATGYHRDQAVEGVVMVQKPYTDETLLAAIRAHPALNSRQP